MTLYRAVLVLFVGLILVLSIRAEHPLDLWLTDNQQGVLFYNLKNYGKAANQFDHDFYKAQAYYANEDFSAARRQLMNLKSAESYFYQGNAYAHEGKLAESLRAYKQALSLSPEMMAVHFNLDYVSGLYELDQKEYQDVGGTGGKLKADKIVFDSKAKDAIGTISLKKMSAQSNNDEVLRALWMRRVQTTPGDFLAMKFQYQLQNRDQKLNLMDDSKPLQRSATEASASNISTSDENPTP